MYERAFRAYICQRCAEAETGIFAGEHVHVHTAAAVSSVMLYGKSKCTHTPRTIEYWGGSIHLRADICVHLYTHSNVRMTA